MISIHIVPARPDDVPVILELIRGLGEYERHKVDIDAAVAAARSRR